MISGNTSAYKGAGLYCEDTSPMVIGCTFKDNLAVRPSCHETFGSGIYNYNSHTTVINCTFSGNRGAWGGAITNDSGSCGEILNCTFTDNIAQSPNSYDYIGGAMCNMYSSDVTVSNCIFWENTPDEVFNSGSTPFLGYCVAQNGNVGDGSVSSNIITTDPVLETLADDGAPTWTCTLGSGSSAINSGKTIESVTTYQRGVPRPQGYGYDIGANEVEQYVISADWSEGGIVSPDIACAVSGDLEDKVLEFLPDSGYDIREVLADGVPASYDIADNTYTFVDISRDHTLYVSFFMTSGDDDDKDKDKDKDDKLGSSAEDTGEDSSGDGCDISFFGLQC